MLGKKYSEIEKRMIDEIIGVLVGDMLNLYRRSSINTGIVIPCEIYDEYHRNCNLIINEGEIVLGKRHLYNKFRECDIDEKKVFYLEEECNFKLKNLSGMGRKFVSREGVHVDDYMLEETEEYNVRLSFIRDYDCIRKKICDQVEKSNNLGNAISQEVESYYDVMVQDKMTDQKVKKRGMYES